MMPLYAVVVMYITRYLRGDTYRKVGKVHWNITTFSLVVLASSDYKRRKPNGCIQI
jgi:hypothetical protein